MRSLTIGLSALALFAQYGLGGEPARKGGPPPSDLSVTTEIQNVDADNNVCTISNDGQGVYQNNVNGVVSILTANVCNGLTWGDWRFNAQGSTRSVMESFLAGDAIIAGDPHYQAPANPPYSGSLLQQPIMNVQCTCTAHQDMYTMAAGDSFTCPLINHWADSSGNQWNFAPSHSFYGSQYPETTDALVTCNIASGGHCVDWFIEPIDIQRPGGNDVEAVGRVVSPPTCKRCSAADDGDYYMRFRIHVTLP